jgi:hypothetical protein
MKEFPRITTLDIQRIYAKLEKLPLCMAYHRQTQLNVRVRAISQQDYQIHRVFRGGLTMARQELVLVAATIQLERSQPRLRQLRHLSQQG